jgi:ribulose-5-phosphate 4-epimerase/fuculose-1-phosphate aldolase
VKNHNNAFMMQNHGALVFGHDMERAIHNVEILEKCALAYLLAICSERKISRIPLGVREIAFAKLRGDQQKAARGERVKGGE